jgi:hypothetical protein
MASTWTSTWTSTRKTTRKTTLHRGTPFNKTVLRRQSAIVVVSVGDEHPPDKWGTSAGAFYETVVSWSQDNAVAIKSAMRSMLDEVARRRHKSVQDYYVYDDTAVPMFRFVSLYTDRTPEPKETTFMLIHAPNFANPRMNYHRAMRLLVDTYRAIAAAAVSRGTGVVMAPLSAGAYAGKYRMNVLKACRSELIDPAPALQRFNPTGVPTRVRVDLYAYTQTEHDVLASM